MDPDDLEGDGLADEGPLFAWLPPEDRLWRHPSEVRPAARQPQRQTGVQRGASRTWTVALMAGVVGALVASGVGWATGSLGHRTTVVSETGSFPTPAVTVAAQPSTSFSWTAVDNAIAPSVASLTVDNAGGVVNGSGILFGAAGGHAYLLTDSSLVSGGGRIQATFQSGPASRAHLVGADPMTGLAVLAVPDVKRIFPSYGSVADVGVAAEVLAIGGRWAAAGSVFAGPVTSEDQHVDLANGSTMENLIAVSAGPLPGEELGGPLADQAGQVVGITVRVDSTDPGTENLLFAVPSDVAAHVAEQIISGSPVSHPWLGIGDAVDLPTAAARQMGIAGGVQVELVWPGSPAAKAGIVANDVVTGLAGHQVTSAGTLVGLLSAMHPGQRATISFLSKGREVRSEMRVANEPSDPTG